MGDCRISFVTATYNHSRFVRDYVRSVVRQTVSDWELVLVDDCSTDGNVEAILSLPDPRVKLIRHGRNEGLNKTLQDAFLASSGNIVCLFASDDTVDAEYAEKMLKAFAEHPEVSVVYAPLRVIDGAGVPTGDLLEMPVDLPREELVAEMILERNRLVSPGMAVRREAFASLLPLNVAAQQCQDYLIHLNLLYRYDFHVLSEPHVFYRRHGGNVSGDGAAVAFRETSECLLLMDAVREMIGGDMDGFVRLFSKRTTLRPKCAADVPFLLGMLALQSSVDIKRHWGFNLMLSCISTVEGAARIYETFGIDYAAIRRLSVETAGSNRSERSVLQDVLADQQRKILKYKRLSLGLSIAVALVLAVVVFLTLA